MIQKEVLKKRKKKNKILTFRLTLKRMFYPLKVVKEVTEVTVKEVTTPNCLQKKCLLVLERGSF